MCLTLEEARYAVKLAAQPVMMPSGDPFHELVAECDDAMKRIADAIAQGKPLSMEQQKFMDLLLKYHTQAHMVGQGPGGSLMMARAQAFNTVISGHTGGTPEADYVLGFFNSLEARDPRYFKDGGFDPDALMSRMRLYQGKLRGTAGQGFVDVLPPTEEIYWVLGGTENHCADCPYNASVSPWTKETLYTTPGGGDTPCLMNCLCHLETKYGTSPKPVPREPL